MIIAVIVEWLSGLGAATLLLIILWPRFGLLARWHQARLFEERCMREDALKHLLQSELNGRRPTINSLAGALHISTDQAADLFVQLEKCQFVSCAEGQWRMETAGREVALHVVRAHRLWESYLADQTGVAESDWHHQADIQEHLLSPQQADALAAKLGNPIIDPHGDSIPEAGRELKGDVGQSLNKVSVDKLVAITHIEDEPQMIYAQLMAQGLRLGMKLRVLRKDSRSIHFWADGKEHVLAPVLADNINVSPVTEAELDAAVQADLTLASLGIGETGKVLNLSPLCRGPERRRLMDLGFVPGSDVTAQMASPAGDPTAYLVRGTLIALRHEQASLIRISPIAA